MNVFVAEINGRAIAAFNAENEIHAEGRAASKPFRADLTVLENEGRPLWNGTDEIFVRKLSPLRRHNLVHLRRGQSARRKLTRMMIG